MITKGIIEQVNKVSVNGQHVNEYRVRLPIFQSVQGYSKIKTNDLPIGIYATPPHMEGTSLNVGDVVYCALEDMQTEYVCILGLIPTMERQTGYKGSKQTPSKVELTNVQQLSGYMSGSFTLPYDTKVMTSVTDQLQDKKGNRHYVDGKEISTLKGVRSDIQPQIDGVTKKIEDLINEGIGPRIIVKKGEFENLTIDKKVWYNKSGLVNVGDSVTIDVTKGLLINTWKANSKLTTLSGLKTKYGFDCGKVIESGKIILEVGKMPISIENGGTGATTMNMAKRNLGISDIEEWLDLLLRDGKIDSLQTLRGKYNIDVNQLVSTAEDEQTSKASGASYGGIIIGHASSSELRPLVYGSAGDQRQHNHPDFDGEVHFNTWQQLGNIWSIVYRPKNQTKAMNMAQKMIAACNNKNIGYSQYERYTLLNALKSMHGGNIQDATTSDFASVGLVNCDCSSLVMTIARSEGYNIREDVVTATMKETYTNANGFDVISPINTANLLPGDILWMGGHTGMVVSVNGI